MVLMNEPGWPNCPVRHAVFPGVRGGLLLGQPFVALPNELQSCRERVVDLNICHIVIRWNMLSHNVQDISGPSVEYGVLIYGIPMNMLSDGS